MASAEEIAAWAKRAGWSGSDLAIAVAVALAESGGDPSNIGDISWQDKTWGPSVGLWQIRSLNADKGTGRTRDEVANKDPQTNANHAHEIWAQSGWKPWTTYVTGKYLIYMPRAIPAAGGASVVVPAVDTAASLPKAILTAAAEPVRILKWLQQPGTQLRIVKVSVGIALVVGALIVFAKPVVEKTAVVAGKAAKMVV